MRRLVGLGCRVSGLFLFVFINVAVSVLICICFTANLRMGEKYVKNVYSTQSATIGVVTVLWGAAWVCVRHEVGA